MTVAAPSTRRCLQDRRRAVTGRSPRTARARAGKRLGARARAGLPRANAHRNRRPQAIRLRARAATRAIDRLAAFNRPANRLEGLPAPQAPILVDRHQGCPQYGLSCSIPFGVMSWSKMAVGIETVQAQLGMSTMPPMRPSTGAVVSNMYAWFFV